MKTLERTSYQRSLEESIKYKSKMRHLILKHNPKKGNIENSKYKTYKDSSNVCLNNVVTVWFLAALW